MCVIAIALTSRLAPADIKLMAANNPHGLGMAWRLDGEVGYRKGITLDLAIRLAEILPMPYVFHARIATQGGNSDNLCHPFPVSENQPRIDSDALLFSREVLFHNGHESSWEAILAASGAKIKAKRLKAMSDTQGIAIALARSNNEKLLQLCSGKFVLLSKKHLKVYGKFDTIDGVQYSNLYWQPRVTTGHDWADKAWSYLHTSKPTGKVIEYQDGKVVELPSTAIESDAELKALIAAEKEAFPDWTGSEAM